MVAEAGDSKVHLDCAVMWSTLRRVTEPARKLAMVEGMAVSEMTEVMRRGDMFAAADGVFEAVACHWQPGAAPNVVIASSSTF